MVDEGSNRLLNSTGIIACSGHAQVISLPRHLDTPPIVRFLLRTRVKGFVRALSLSHCWETVVDIVNCIGMTLFHLHVYCSHVRHCSIVVILIQTRCQGPEMFEL